MIGAVNQNILFLFQTDKLSCKLFFVFKFMDKTKIQHFTMRRDAQTRKLLILVVLSHKENSELIFPHLIDISYDKLVLNLALELSSAGLKHC